MTSPEARFTADVAEIYDRELGRMIFQPYADELARRLADLSEGELLEVAAGTGIVTAALRRTLPPSVRITATDLNPAMLAVGQAKPGLDGVGWQVADGSRLPFPDEAFDALVCSFGVMFYPDRAAGYAEAHRVLRPGGRLLFTVWDTLETNELTRAVHDVVVGAFPQDPPDFLPRVPFGYTDPDLIRRQVADAGFSDIRIDAVTRESRAESARQAATGLCQGTPLRSEIESRGDLQRVTDRAAAALEAEFGSGPIAAPMQALLVTAVR